MNKTILDIYRQHWKVLHSAIKQGKSCVEDVTARIHSFDIERKPRIEVIDNQRRITELTGEVIIHFNPLAHNNTVLSPEKAAQLPLQLLSFIQHNTEQVQVLLNGEDMTDSVMALRLPDTLILWNNRIDAHSIVYGKITLKLGLQAKEPTEAKAKSKAEINLQDIEPLEWTPAGSRYYEELQKNLKELAGFTSDGRAVTTNSQGQYRLWHDKSQATPIADIDVIKRFALETKREIYYSQHSACPDCGFERPKCGTKGYEFTTLEQFRDRNTARCFRCNWQGIVHDLKPQGYEPEPVGSSYHFTTEALATPPEPSTKTEPVCSSPEKADQSCFPGDSVRLFYGEKALLTTIVDNSWINGELDSMKVQTTQDMIQKWWPEYETIPLNVTIKVGDVLHTATIHRFDCETVTEPAPNGWAERRYSTGAVNLYLTNFKRATPQATLTLDGVEASIKECELKFGRQKCGNLLTGNVVGSAISQDAKEAIRANLGIE